MGKNCSSHSTDILKNSLTVGLPITGLKLYYVSFYVFEMTQGHPINSKVLGLND